MKVKLNHHATLSSGDQRHYALAGKAVIISSENSPAPNFPICASSTCILSVTFMQFKKSQQGPKAILLKQ